MPRMLYVVVIGTAAVLMACADSGGTDPNAPGTTASTTASTTGSASAGPTGSTSAAPTASPPASPTGRPPGTPPAMTTAPAELTLRGSVQDGVEPGCLLLTAQDGRQYLLLGGDRQVLQSHSEIVVRGRPQPNLATTCQQGIPFTVSDVRPA
jgi:hypothetical protein